MDRWIDERMWWVMVGLQYFFCNPHSILELYDVVGKVISRSM